MSIKVFENSSLSIVQQDLNCGYVQSKSKEYSNSRNTVCSPTRKNYWYVPSESKDISNIWKSVYSTTRKKTAITYPVNLRRCTRRGSNGPVILGTLLLATQKTWSKHSIITISNVRRALVLLDMVLRRWIYRRSFTGWETGIWKHVWVRHRRRGGCSIRVDAPIMTTGANNSVKTVQAVWWI